MVEQSKQRIYRERHACWMVGLPGSVAWRRFQGRYTARFSGDFRYSLSSDRATAIFGLP